MKKLPVEIKTKKLPKDRVNSLPYTYHGRTSGGFVDAIFLGSLILTSGVWFLLLIIAGGK